MVWGLGFVALFAAAVPLLSQDGRTINSVILQGREWTFSVLQSFGAGLRSVSATVDAADDLTMSAPTLPPTGMVTSGVSGSCLTSRSYRFYKAWANQSGITSLGPTSSPDFTPSITNRRTTITFADEAPPADATVVVLYYSGSNDSHAAKKLCAIGSLSSSSVAVGTTTFDCGCQGTTQNPGNTTSVLARTRLHYQAELRAAQEATSVDKTATVDKNRLRLNGTSPLWSNDAGVNFATMNLLGAAQVVQVCKAGCTYSTVTSALAAITDSAITKRYAILIGPGNYDENITMKSYVSLVGQTTPSEVHIRGTSLNNSTALIPTDVTEVGFFNIWLSGAYTIQTQVSGGSTPGDTIYIFGSWVGNLDGTDAIRSQSAIDCGTGNPGHIFRIGNSWLRGDENVIISGADQTFYDLGSNLYELDCSAFTGPAAAFIGVPGDSIRFVGGAGSMIRMRDTGTTCTAMTGISWSSPNSPSRTSYLRWNGHIEMERTNASNNNAMTGVSLASIAAAQDGWLDLSGMTTNIVSAGSGTLKSVQVSSDADLADWSVNWNGGSSRLTGSGTKNDINNDATVAGFALNVSGVQLPNGVAGAGSVNGSATLFGNFGTRLQIPPEADLVADTCTIGEIKVDSGGATREFCWGYNNGGTCRWACVSATIANGPTN